MCITALNRAHRFCLSLALPLFVSMPAAAFETESATFDVKLRGITAARVQYVANSDGTAYAVTGLMRATGLVGAVVEASYEATARGRKRGVGSFAPSSFSEIRNDGDGTTTAEMGYRNGIPSVKKYNPPRDADPFAVAPSEQRGTVDPMTAIWAALRDQPRNQVCALDVTVFDGKRRSGVRLRSPKAQGNGTITCQGEYRRIKGWSPEKLAERTRFPFTMTYAESEQGDWQVVRVTTQTSFGSAELRRR